MVTGAGSGTGQSIIKALNLSSLKLSIFSSDINPSNAGLYRTKNSVIIPPVEKKNSLRIIINILKKYKIKILFIGSEYELKFFGKNKDIIEKETQTKVCVTSTKIINLSNDKYATIKFLRKSKLPFPESYLIKKNNLNKMFYKLRKPFILKNRFGTSARDVYLIKDKKDYLNNLSIIKFPMIQEYLRGKRNIYGDEYTCSVFTDIKGYLKGPFLSQRYLKNGNSWIVRTIQNNKLSKLVIKISKALGNTGTINIQLKKKNKNFLPIEINSRFSGTTCIRAALGFNEPEMYIKSFYLNKSLNNIKIKKGFVFRYIEEIFVNTDNSRKLKNNFSEGKIIKWF